MGKLKGLGWLLGGFMGLAIAVGLALFCFGRLYGDDALAAGGLATLCTAIGLMLALLLGLAAKLMIDEP